MAAPLDDRAFLGVGWAFPVTADASGEAALAAHEEDVRQAIQIILGTDPGERVMRPDFGAGLKALVFEPIGASTAALVRHRVEEALVRWEPRIDVLDVSVTDDGPAGNRLLVHIDYRIRSTNTFYNLVYPFYLLEGQPA
ncbi:MAG TPA: GPW/gp25 family protein [Gaiellaceae bacterium]